MKRRFAAAIAMAAALCGVLGCASKPEPQTLPLPSPAPSTVAPEPLPPLRRPDLYAYITDDELKVREGAHLLVTVPGTFTAASDLGFTTDHEFVYWREAQPDGTTTLAAVRLDRPDETIRIACGACGTILPSTGARLVWHGADAETITRVDLFSPERRPEEWRTLPPGMRPGRPPGGIGRTTVWLLASRGDRLLLSRTFADYPARTVTNDLFTIEQDGSTRNYGRLAGVNGFTQRAMFNPDGTQAVVFADPSGGADSNPCVRTTAALLDLAAGTYRTTAPKVDDCAIPTRIRWQRDELTITLDTWRGGGTTQQVERTTRWQYRDQNWSPEPDPNLIDRDRTRAGNTVELTSKTHQGPFYLYFHTSREITLWANNVHAFAIG
ncbi:hypothetical protein [Nocardia sp. NPDC052566]|uniref:hypothetical protein n=1 Tax=Nocardia sp. NPDC052566 TaxID=3364330 RepID=UPI0037C55B4C